MVTDYAIEELERYVSEFSARDEPILETSDGKPHAWGALLADQIRSHKARWAALSEEEKQRVESAEATVARHYATLREAEAYAHRSEPRRRHLEKSGCRLTDEATAALVHDAKYLTEALSAVNAWRGALRKPWLVISGMTGCGKSFAAASETARVGGLWVRADEAVRVWWANFGEQYERQNAFRNAPLLVLDDAGCELDAARMLALLLDLLDARKSARQHPTVVTTNLNKLAFAERYANERLMSRMHESVDWSAMEVGGDLRRLPKGER